LIDGCSRRSGKIDQSGEAVDQEIVKPLVAHGLWGVAVLILLLVVRHLYSQVQDLHEKRLTDMKAFLDQYRAAIDTNTKTVEAWTRAALERRGP
jgi:hypothetical protein